MKPRSLLNRAAPLTVWLAIVFCVAVLSGCLGGQARTHVLAPAIKAGSTYAIKCASASPNAGEAKLTEFQAAVDAQDAATIKAMWPNVYAAALDGIAQRKDVSEGVKVSLREPLLQLDAAIAELQP